VQRTINLEGTNDTAILIVHGFSNTPYSLMNLADALNELGYNIRLITLKGHVDTEEAFLKVKFQEWISQVVGEYRALQENFEHVFIVGHSMGSLLASIVDEKVNIMLSPPLFIRNFGFYLSPILSKLGLKKFKWDDGVPLTEDEETNKILEEVYNGWVWVRPSVQLNKLIKWTIDYLNDSELPTSIFCADNDEIVNMNKTITYFTRQKRHFDKLKMIQYQSDIHNLTYNHAHEIAREIHEIIEENS
jgi:carboxylesterase